MDSSNWTIIENPYDLRERLVLFACLIVRVSQHLRTRDLTHVHDPIIQECAEPIRIVATVGRNRSARVSNDRR